MTTSENVRSMIEEELPVGASADDIESFLERNSTSFSWDRISGTYVAIIREVTPAYAITIDIFVDEQRRFVRAEVLQSYY